ncbi:hypothetical protein ACIBK8_12530 [Streptomyces sp. NPDC050161]|uniref:hypothetical protein n=1 Tax=Streptomyces sp. NPDC050161 TaxID=3365604 RepID=UPI00379C0A18
MTHWLMAQNPEDHGIPESPLTTPRGGLCGESCMHWGLISRALEEAVASKNATAAEQVIQLALLHKTYGHPEDPRPSMDIEDLYDMRAVRAAFLD